MKTPTVSAMLRDIQLLIQRHSADQARSIEHFVSHGARGHERLERDALVGRLVRRHVERVRRERRRLERRGQRKRR